MSTRHILLRDRCEWLGALSGLQVDGDGTLTLARVPAPAGGAISAPTAPPYPREVSGIALGPCDAVFVSDTAGNRVLFVDGLCDAQVAFGDLDSPRGLAFSALALLVADSGHGRVQHFALPALEASNVWTAWTQPTSLSLDSKGRVLVVEAGANAAHRVEHDGTADAAFDAAVAASGRIAAPLFIAAGREDRVIVSDASANQVLVFDAHGAFLRVLDGPGGWQPGALTCIGQRIYAADATTGAILVFDDGGLLQGSIPGFRGPVTAMAASPSGDLYVKTGLDAAYVVLGGDLAYVSEGSLETGPFDAGERCDWECARIDFTLPPETSCEVEIAQLPAATPGPAAADWLPLPCADSLLGRLLPGAAEGERRYLWVRMTLSTTSPRVSPQVAQVHAATPGENYLEHLPFTYTRNDQRKDGKEGFLSRLLKLVRGEWRNVEELIDAIARVADPAFLQASSLPWLAQWLALELPQIAGDDERGELIARAVRLFARRGTPASIAEFVELHTGIRPAIVEAFEGRRVWILGSGSRLDFETQLPPLDPNGMIVPDTAVEEPCAAATSDAGLVCKPGPLAGPSDAPTPEADAGAPRRAGTLGRAIVGESGPLAEYQIGMPLFSEDAYRFCVLVDAYRARQEGTLQEIRRIVDREKPAHTDYRIELLEPNLRIGLQARVGIDAIVGGDPSPWQASATLGFGTRLAPPDDASRVGEVSLGESMTLT
jgi:phage tail-like protein